MRSWTASTPRHGSAPSSITRCGRNWSRCEPSAAKSIRLTRGLHFQLPPQDQGKLVRCVKGSILDVAVDIRRGSPTYGHWVGVELTAQRQDELWVPSGFAHGFVTRQADCEVAYKTSRLPHTPDVRRLNDLCVGLGEDYLGEEA